MGRTGYVKQPGTWHALSAALPDIACKSMKFAMYTDLYYI